MKTFYVLKKSEMPASSFQQLLRLWQKQAFTHESGLMDFQRLRHSSPEWNLILRFVPCLTWIVDVRRQQFAYVSPNVQRLLGYSPEHFQQEGLLLLSKLIHPDDTGPVWERAIRIWKLLMDQPPFERQHYRYNSDYRIRRADGTFLRLMEQNVVLQTDRHGNITHLMSVLSDMTAWKNSDELMTSLLSAQATAQRKQPVTEQPIKTTPLLSKREREVVQLMAQGLSSKLIAERLHIAFNTVSTHRKNILEKTKASNAGGVVQLAIREGLI